MPLLDHFRPPLAPRRHWESFHASWAGSIADALNRQLPPEFFAEEHAHAGARVEVDVATFEDSPAARPAPANGPATAVQPQVWAPPAPDLVMPVAFPDRFEVLVFHDEGGARLVAAVELVSPGNKDRPAERRAFAVKCASYLCQGIGLILLDVVATRRGNLHNEVVQVLGLDAPYLLPDDVDLYAVAYRPLRRGDAPQADVWSTRLALGAALPVLPLAVGPDLCLPLALEDAYADACRRRRLP
jgi:hypothetical protein